jgi:hypothetical protein
LFSNGADENEFVKGKATIAVLSLDQMPTVIDALIAAVRNGELDEVLILTARARSSLVESGTRSRFLI